MGRSYKKKRTSRQYERKKRTIKVKVPATTYKRGGKTIHREAYTYERVDVGRPGKGPKLIPVEKGKLTKFGYSTKKSARARHEALRKAIKRYGALSVFRKLNAMVIVRKRTQPEAREIFEADRDWVRDQYKLDGFVS